MRLRSMKEHLMRVDIRKQLRNFLAAPYKRTWLYAKPIEFYVRKSRHFINGEFVQTFDLATINIADRTQRGKGYFTILVEEVESLGLNVFVEQILEPRLFEFFSKRGYIKDGDNMFRKAS